MRIVKSELEAVAVKPGQYPEAGLPEIAFAGRSNVGKSSLLNLITGRKSLARVSGSPGKTRTINFYRCTARIEDNNIYSESMLRIVDLPGYGFAKISRSESEKWGEMMESYLENRADLKKVVLLVDVRHKPTAQDVQMYDYLKYYGLDGIVVATKADKVSNNERAKNLKVIKQTLGMEKGDVIIPVSAMKRTGDTELLRKLKELIGRR